MYQITIKDTETGDGISYLTECFAMAIRPAGEEGTIARLKKHDRKGEKWR